MIDTPTNEWLKDRVAVKQGSITVTLNRIYLFIDGISMSETVNDA